MAKKKGSSDWDESQDTASVEAEVTDDGYDADEPTTASTTKSSVSTPRVTIEDPPKPKEPELSPTTKAEMEAGAAAIKQAEDTKKEAQAAEAKAKAAAADTA